MGSYESSYQYDEKKRQVISSCRIQINCHVIPFSKYDEAAKFFSDVIKEQQQKIVAMKES